MWRRNRIRLEDGIFFSDDSWIPLTTGDDGRLKAGERTSLEEILESNPDGWTEVDPSAGCEASIGGLKVVGGGGAWDGEGFVALLDSTTLRPVWVLHVSTGSRFRTVAVADSMILAVSGEPPEGREWSIPVGNPGKAEVSAGPER
jgi:hypothetical protein